MMTLTMPLTMVMTSMAIMMTKKTMITQVIDHEEDNLSDKETYSKNIPAIGDNDWSIFVKYLHI